MVHRVTWTFLMTAWWTTLDLSGVKSAMAERSSRMFSSFFQTLQKDEANLHSDKSASQALIS